MIRFIRFATASTALVFATLALQPFAAQAQAPTPKPAPVAVTDTALPKDSAAKLELHNKQLHDRLGITAAQQPQWDQFTAAMRSNAVDMRRTAAERGAKLDTMNAAENMQSFADLAKIHAANMERAATAFQSLYAVLSPQQKTVADQAFRNHAERHAAKKG